MQKIIDPRHRAGHVTSIYIYMSGLVATGYTRYVSQNKRKTNKW